MTDKERAAELFEQLKQALSSTDEEDGYDLDPEVETWDDKHYYVTFKIGRAGVALEPDDARELAESLLTAADEADAKMAVER